MNRLRCAALAAVLAASGCSGSSEVSLDQIEQALQSCTQTGVLDLLRIFTVLADVADAAEGDSVDGVTVTPSADPGDPPNTFDFSAAFPASGNGPDDTTVAGKITFSADPTDGIADGDTFSVTASVTSNGGPLSGSVDLQGTYGQSVLAGDLPPPEAEPVFAVQGMLSLVNALDGCTIEADFDTPFVVDFQPELLARQLSARILGIEMFGSFTLSLTALGNTLTSTITIAAGGQTAQVDGELLGEAFDFSTELFPAEEDIFAALACFEEASFLIDEVTSALEELPDAAVNPGAHPDVEITQGSALNVFDYVVTRGALTISGEVTLPPIGTGDATATFTLEATGGLAGIETPTFTGTNVDGPLTFAVTTGMVESFFGALRFTSAAEGCTVTFTVPEDDPVGADLGGSGTVFAEVVRGNLTMTFEIDLAAPPDEEFVSATVNGVPVPANALLGFFVD